MTLCIFTPGFQGVRLLFIILPFLKQTEMLYGSILVYWESGTHMENFFHAVISVHFPVLFHDSFIFSFSLGETNEGRRKTDEVLKPSGSPFISLTTVGNCDILICLLKSYVAKVSYINRLTF